VLVILAWHHLGGIRSVSTNLSAKALASPPAILIGSPGKVSGNMTGYGQLECVAQSEMLHARSGEQGVGNTQRTGGKFTSQRS
jgi:hypothetical protein